MAYKQSSPLTKLLMFAAVVFVGYKFAYPWVMQHLGAGVGSTKPSAHAGCVRQAEYVSNMWSDGFPRFMNPPVDAAAWSSYRSEIDKAIAGARSQCGCEQESCRKSREALSTLTSLISDMDAAVRSGGPPRTDFVGAQERVNNLLFDARALASTGR